ncbi:MAG: POTRA domain-containing protein, partial [Acidobacteriota bacterium]
MPQPSETFDIAPRRPVPVAWRRAVLALVLAVVGWVVPSGATVAAPATPLDEPRFLIESLEVVGNQRVTDEILLAESLLIPGRAYLEAELSDAVFRLRRLPFIYDANFRLTRGSERGRYRLVIEIDEIRRFFFGENLQATRFGGDREVALGNVFAGGDSLSASPLAGVRFFFGRHHEVFGSLAVERGVQIGYNRYDLFGRLAVLSLGLTAQGCCPSQVFPLGSDPTFASWEGDGDFNEARIALGLPLSGSRHLRIAASFSISEEGFRSSILGDSSFRRSLPYQDLETGRLEVVWSDDTTDDPIFPSRGRRRSLSLDLLTIDARLFAPRFVVPGESLNLPDGVALGDALPSTSSRQWRLSFTDSRHWGLGRRQTVSLTGRLAIGTASIEGLARLDEDCSTRIAGFCANDLVFADDDRFTIWEASLRLSHAVRLGSERFRREHGDLRFETTVEIGWDDNESMAGLDGDPLARRSAGVAVIYRNR